MSDEKSDDKPVGRDEKGLTLSHRALLRVTMEYSRAMMASAKIGEGVNIRDIMDNPVILARIQDLVGFGLMMGKKIGSLREVDGYLRSHEEEDDKFFKDQKDEVFKSLIESDLDRLHNVLMAGPACETCGEKTCLGCKKCHACEEKKVAPTLN